MSQERVHVTFTRGGRELGRRAFTLSEATQMQFGDAVQHEGLTWGLEDYEVYVRSQEDDREISAHNREEMTLERVLRDASQDGEITGKSFTVDVTAEHRGAAAGGEG